MNSVYARLLSSRKVQIALATIVVSILVQLGFDAGVADKITDAAIVVAVVVIGGIAVEDASAKFKAGPGAVGEVGADSRTTHPHPNPLPGGEGTNEGSEERFFKPGNVLTILLAAVCMFSLIGCVGKTPDAKYAQQRKALSSANNLFSTLAEQQVLTDQQTVQIGEGLQLAGTYLDAAKTELPAGGDQFDRLLRQADQALGIIQSRLAAAKKKERSDGNSSHDRRDYGGARSDLEHRRRGADRAAAWNDHRRTVFADRGRGEALRRAA